MKYLVKKTNLLSKDFLDNMNENLPKKVFVIKKGYSFYYMYIYYTLHLILR